MNPFDILHKGKLVAAQIWFTSHLHILIVQYTHGLHHTVLMPLSFKYNNKQKLSTNTKKIQKVDEFNKSKRSWNCIKKYNKVKP